MAEAPHRMSVSNPSYPFQGLFIILESVLFYFWKTQTLPPELPCLLGFPRQSRCCILLSLLSGGSAEQWKNTGRSADYPRSSCSAFTEHLVRVRPNATLHLLETLSLSQVLRMLWSLGGTEKGLVRAAGGPSAGVSTLSRGCSCHSEN